MRRRLLTLITTLSLLMPLLASPSLAFAAPAADLNKCPDATTSSGQVLTGIGETGDNCDSSGVSNVLSEIVNLISYVAGAIAIIMVILAGVKYTTSGGESGRVANAKGTLLYALIGIAVAALAQVLVHYVLSNSNALASS